MIVHIALFKWKPEVTQSQIEQALKEVKALKTASEGIVDIFCGENHHKESKGLTHGIVVITKDQKSLKKYRNHPLHLAIAKNIEQMEEDGIGFDFEDFR